MPSGAAQMLKDKKMIGTPLWVTIAAPFGISDLQGHE